MRSWIVQHRLQVGGLLVALCLVIAATLSRVGGDDASDRATGVGAPIAAPAVTAGVEGLLVPSGDDEALAVALLELATDADKRLAMGRAAAEQATTEH